MELCDAGDLDSQIQKRQAPPTDYFSEDEVLMLFAQICLGLKSVHDKKIMHRNLSSLHIFLKQVGNFTIAKLGSMSVARVLEHTAAVANTQAQGMVFYIAPEVIRGSPYDRSSDIWSLGILLYEMAALKHPFESTQAIPLIEEIKKGKYH